MPNDLTAVGTLSYPTGKFGAAVDTTNGYLSFTPASAFSADAFTIEYFAKTSSASGFQIVFGRANNEWWGFNAGKPATSVNSGSGLGSVSMADGAWHHYAWTIDGTNWKLYVDGTLIATIGSTARPNAWSSSGGGSIVHVGRWASNAAGDNPSFAFQGQIDELRLSKTTLRYTAAFTPPTAAFSGDATTTGLYHFDSSGADSAASSTPALTATTAPAITPTSGLAAGTVMSTTNGAWSATPDSYAYQWNRAGAAITNATSSSYTLVSADLGQAITCTVTATKANYTPGSSTSNSVTPPAAGATAPGAPTGLTASAGNAQATLSWTAPSSTGGAAISDYTVQSSSDNGSTWTTFTRAASTTTSATVTGLTNGTAYLFRVAAVNSVGTSSWSATASATPSATAGTIAPNDGNVVYSPYNWQVTSTYARTNCSGSYLRTAVKGTPTGITAGFDLTGISGAIAYVATVDGTVVSTGSIAASVTIAIPNNGWPEHTVELLFPDLYGGTDKWTAAPTRSVKFTGFTMAPTSATSATCRRRPINILCFGDSIAEGYSAISSGNIDGRLGWAHPLGGLLGAEVGVVGYSAQGYTKTGVGGVPVFSSTYNQLTAGVSRSFTTPTEPDLVLINMGTNDNGADITSAMTTVLNGILAATTTSKIVIIQQWNGTLYKSAMQSIIAGTTAPSRITYLDTTGWLVTSDTADNTHPWGYINLADLSPRIAAAVRPLLTGGSTFTPKRFVNVGGTAKAIG